MKEKLWINPDILQCCVDCRYAHYNPKRYPCDLCRWDKKRQRGSRYIKLRISLEYRLDRLLDKMLCIE